MSSVGDTLRRERLRKELTLEQISRETKISHRLLEAIEKDQFDRLPGGVFAKSFVRQYGNFLGLKGDDLAGEVERSMNPGADLPSFAQPEPAIKVPRVVEWEGGNRSNSSALPALAGVVTVMLVCSAVYTLWQRSRRAAPVTQAPPPAQTAPAAPSVETKPEPAPGTDVVPSEPSPAGAAAGPLNANPAAVLHVSLITGGEVWVHVWADNKSVLEGVMKPSEAKDIEATDAVRVRTGNAGDLQMSVNGKPVGEIGPRGQIRVVEVTTKGVQILLPPPKPASPAEPL